MAASWRSTGVRGATKSALGARSTSGVGRAFRSTLPLDVSGSASSGTKAAGTMYSGSRCCTCCRSSAVSSAWPAAATT